MTSIDGQLLREYIKRAVSKIIMEATYHDRLYKRMKKPDEMYDLELYIDSDSGLYSKRKLPIIKQLANKRAGNQYDHQKAIKAFLYLVDDGAKKYAKITGDIWYEKYPKEDRLKLAEIFAYSFEEEYDFGNYNNLLSNKYQNK